jgi:hypothetical protein
MATERGRGQPEHRAGEVRVPQRGRTRWRSTEGCTSKRSPRPRGARSPLACRLGYEEFPRAAFLEKCRRITRRTRGATERVFCSDDD